MRQSQPPPRPAAYHAFSLCPMVLSLLVCSVVSNGSFHHICILAPLARDQRATMRSGDFVLHRYSIVPYLPSLDQGLVMWLCLFNYKRLLWKFRIWLRAFVTLWELLI